MSFPFGNDAERYWAKPLSVIPLEPATKRPAFEITNWTGYCDNLPKPDKRARWLTTCRDHGIGLCLGWRISSDFRIAAVDVDDNALVRVTEAILGSCICAKRGQKGMTFFVKVPNGARVKSTTISNFSNKGVIDILFGGKMTVLPPSIHPLTRLPYVWSSLPLLDIDFGNLPVLDDVKLNLLRLVIGSEHAPSILSGENTHEPGLRLTAQLVSAGCEHDIIEKIFEALLPISYDGNSLVELSEWIRSAQSKNFGATERGEKRPSIASRLFAYVEASGATLFHDEGMKGYMSVPSGGGIRHFGLRSSEAAMWLTKLFYDAEKTAVGARALEEVVSLLTAKAQFEAPQYKTYLRVGGTRERISIDLGTDDGSAVILTAGRWVIAPDNETKLVRSAGFAKLPEPTKSGDLSDLRSLLSLDDDAWVLVLAFLLLCLRPSGGFMVLLVEGEQGSGKSFLCMVIKKIIDPNQVEKGRLPDSERDLMIHAKDYFLLSFDNVSGMKGDISDALCILATGGGFGTRKLYTDDEQFVFNFCRPVMINGIADFVNRPDLLERSIPLRLTAMSDHGRRTEEEMLDEIDRILPGILGGLYEIAARAIGARPDTSVRPTLRMADCERWLLACEPHTGLEKGSFIRAIRNAQDEISIERAQNDVVIAPLLALLKDGPFEGTVAELHQRIASGDQRADRYFPPTPAHLSKHLTRLRPAMTKAGVLFAFGPRTHQGRKLRVWLVGQEGKAATPSPFSPGY
ncbi:bifunctional DNA primase/polymerase [Bradyrhizobium sp. th.b2]|uniref:bifunctional DNA primase/polymerase n=1 Tax=Bradyrhizobium sp. th-b2 TaxID=172088 RepID=UPI0003FED93A|nr:bifunctional DNA primase/polymerase [Bradyrhizobium sp. th.b2]